MQSVKSSFPLSLSECCACVAWEARKGWGTFLGERVIIYAPFNLVHFKFLCHFNSIGFDMQTIFLKTSSETLLSLISAIETKQDIFLYMVLSYDNTVYNRAKARS